ncbi:MULTISPECIES: 3-hydroxybutyryl-CoA dehydrogenase [unclassified Acidisoma]|jgi:3-hydroxybutyryl-CoA dehydrogenase|uniref:3-hydroxybutyryl-CoA dehydrogenase n=1 Tax=unclassified Acidisoma TaxID=2634065 RepID=UPI00131B457C|nr:MULTISPECIES: 3-hydroxybutyryl-CoA dehydrogenase [unclassified Acidisoma]
MTAKAIETIGVIGAGQMGQGIAQVSAVAGLGVTLLDVAPEVLERALAAIDRNLGRQEQKGILTAEARGAARARIRTATENAGLSGCDLVIEAATEREEVKLAILKGLVPHLKPAALIASNTSSISITRLAAATDRPERVIGMHFMNPVPVMKLVEVIRGIATSDATFETVKALAERMGKTVAVAQDHPAFLVNRILVPMINEAVFALADGVGSVAAIDTAMKLGTNQPMGPLELGDFIGLDTCLSIMRVLHSELGEDKYRPCPLLVKYVEAGWVGRKAKRGFYDYAENPPRPTR